MDKCYLSSKNLSNFKTGLAKKFRVQPEYLPSFIIYVPHKGVFSSLIGTFEEDNIKRFIAEFNAGRTALYNVSLSDGDFNRIKCETLQDEKVENGKLNLMFRG